MELVYVDDDILVCLKPARVLSTDEPGGVPELAREALGDPGADVRTVHRLDRVVSGLMVLARNAKAASELSRQIRDNEFEKEYMAVVHGCPEADCGIFRDLLGRDKARKTTYVAAEPAKGVQEAVLDYTVLGRRDALSRVRIRLHTLRGLRQGAPVSHGQDLHVVPARRERARRGLPALRRPVPQPSRFCGKRRPRRRKESR